MATKVKKGGKKTAEQARAAVKDALGKADEKPELTPEQIEQQKADAEEQKRMEEFAKKWEKWPIENIDVERIEIENRYRGDEDLRLEKLAKSIARFGLMQPIGVRDMGDGSYRLVTGGRRLLAVRDHLRRKKIRAIVFEPDAEKDVERLVKFLEMEVEENEERHNPSIRKKAARFTEISEILAKTGKGKKGDTPRREKAAAAAGISPETHRQAQIVFKAAKEDPEKFGEVARQMDVEEVPVATAYKQVIKEKLAFDEVGHYIPSKKLKEAFIARDQFKHIISGLRTIQRQLDELANGNGGERLDKLPPEILTAKTTATDNGPVTKYSSPLIAQLVKALDEAAPFSLCPVCAEESGELGKASRGCKMCFGSCHIGESAFNDLTKAGDKSVGTLKKVAAKAEKEAA